MPATQKRQRGLRTKPFQAGQPHKVLHLTSYDRLEEYLAPSPRGISTC